MAGVTYNSSGQVSFPNAPAGSSLPGAPAATIASPNPTQDQIAGAIAAGGGTTTLDQYNAVAKPAATDNTEGDGNPSSKDPSDYGVCTTADGTVNKGGAINNDDGAPNLPSNRADFLSKLGLSYGTNANTGRPSTSKIKPDASSVDNAQKNKAKQGLDQSHPTAGSQDPSQAIHDAILAADPSATAAIFLKKALQSMVMLKMMDKLTSPAGILSMASGGLGGALQGLAGQVGLGSMMGALNSVMPALSVSGLLASSATNALHSGMIGMMNNVAVGALAASEVAAATNTASNVSNAMQAIAAGSPDAVDAVAQFGGPAFGLQPGSLASKIALIGPSGYVRTSSNIGGVTINTVIQTSPNPHPTQNIPVLTGTEHVEIATAAVSNIAGTLSNVLGVNSGVGQALGSISDVTAGISNLAGSFSNIASFGPSSLAGVVNGGIGGIVDGGLNKILGFPMSGLLGNVTKLLPQIGGNITGSISAFPKSSLSAGKMNTVMQNATKAMSLSKAAHNVAQNIFGQSRAEHIVDAITSTANLAAAVGGPISMVTAFGDRITSSPANAIKSIVSAGTQVVVGNTTRLV